MYITMTIMYERQPITEFPFCLSRHPFPLCLHHATGLYDSKAYGLGYIEGLNEKYNYCIVLNDACGRRYDVA